MKVRLLMGNYYRREGGVLVKYKAGDVFEASPAECSKLEVKEQIFVRKPKEVVDKVPAPAPIPAPEPEPEEILADEEVEESSDESFDEEVEESSDELSDEDLLDKYAERSGSWYTFADGTRIQGRVNAIQVARELNG